MQIWAGIHIFLSSQITQMTDKLNHTQENFKGKASPTKGIQSPSKNSRSKLQYQGSGSGFALETASMKLSGASSNYKVPTEITRTITTTDRTELVSGTGAETKIIEAMGQNLP